MPSDLLLPLPAQATPSQLACLVMVDLVGSTRLAHLLPLDHYTSLMAEFVQVLILSFEARGGQVLQHQGDAVLALWNEHQVSAGITAALEAHERSARLSLAAMLGVTLQVRSGVAVGQVITGMVGGQRSAYGLPVNYACRLCSAADPGETLVCGGASEMASLPHVAYLPRHLLTLHGFNTECVAFTAQLRPSTAPHQNSHMKAG
ncbi:adenylate/guanylate cyclase domain-containing protein [Deinococcus sp. Arct2-2]|uniref:adenylate/guanylate cyclase domain-containing protein n=1 Tax=Deinococcus sp. Arct2-2 TaxID=2568653 RepID=UPI0010A4DF62|nr:adenylate/guanylate cyclase domain-containing protein [Deinococcus sp. Arct2-2]THF71249.1 adenylate/guanylate cyclase domain-containing protein [Deinococcus sp. Arct2-2]